MWLSKKRILNKKQLPLAQPALGESNEEKEHGEKIALFRYNPDTSFSPASPS